ncbi:hypothetical protein LTR66_015052 [Elasticomyces elasticus]|nr:hypothetical protein LTR66_015052 [Elasticomyces elasticus]
MATPNRSQPVSTPKNPTPSSTLQTTPTSRNSFNAFAGKRPHLSGKAPTKGPLGHARKMSISSQQVRTPTAALNDDLLALNSPSAALLGETGLTPLPSGIRDVLGMGLPAGSMKGVSILALASTLQAKDNATEKHNRLKEMVNSLSSRAAGRGLSVQSIEHLAKIHGFEYGLDEGILTIAQKRVDLEIEFDDEDTNTVRRVELKLHPAKGDADPVFQRADSEVLHSNLTTKKDEHLPWLDMTDFSANLAYLNKLEQTGVDTKNDCFETMDNLFNTFQRIWTEEKKKLSWRHNLQHACQGNIGEPRRHVDGRLGLRSTYWTRGKDFYGSENKVPRKRKAEEVFIADFSCEKGRPDIPASQQWLPEEETLRNIPTSSDLFHQAVDKPAWQDPRTISTKVDQNVDEMNIDEALQLATGIDTAVRFTCRLKPGIFLPLYIVNELNTAYQIVEIDQSKITNILGSPHSELSTAELTSTSTKVQHIYTDSGQHQLRKHQYNVSVPGQVMMARVDRLFFNHPQRFAEALPTMRQYALLETLLASLELNSATTNAIAPNTSSRPVKQAAQSASKILPNGRIVTIRTNKPRLASKLEYLSGNELTPSPSSGSSTLNTPLTPSRDETIRIIDVRVDLVSFLSTTKAVRIELSLPIPQEIQHEASPSQYNRNPSKKRAYLSFTFDVLPNGTVEVAEPLDEDSNILRPVETRRKLSKVIRATEDIGMVVEWLLREVTKEDEDMQDIKPAD